ncbi:hypothetical protein LLE81_09175 [Staphylococcus epidermidis]|nr:hypothetical protein [Staphylococcus epidermidis]
MRSWKPVRLQPDAAGQLVRDHARMTKRLAESEAFTAALQREIRRHLGTETLWSLQHAARQAVALEQLQKELVA